jgi:hypothetical protein
MSKNLYDLANNAAQIGVIAVGVDLAFMGLNGGTFPLTSKLVGSGSQVVSKVAYTVIEVVGPVKGSVILGLTALYVAEKCEVTHLQHDLKQYFQDLQHSFQSYFSLNQQEIEVTGQDPFYEI